MTKAKYTPEERKRLNSEKMKRQRKDPEFIKNMLEAIPNRKLTINNPYFQARSLAARISSFDRRRGGPVPEEYKAIYKKLMESNKFTAVEAYKIIKQLINKNTSAE